MNLNEITDNSFRQPEESQQTIHTFSAKDTSHKGLRRTDNEDLNRLKEELENYINGLLGDLKQEIYTANPVRLEGEAGAKGEKGDKGDRGYRGYRGYKGEDGSCADEYSAGNGIAISEEGVISVVPTDFMDVCS